MLSVTEIKRFIDEDISSEKKRLAAVGQRYAEGEHDILKCRLFYYNADGELVEDTTRTNIKIPHPFFMELSEQLAPYMLSFKENPIRAKEVVKDLQEHLDRYFDDAFWAEINELITGAYNKGFEYLYSYKKGNVKAKKSGENKLIFKCADSMGVIEVREQDTDDHCKYIIYWYIDRIEKGRKEIKRIQVWSEQDTTYYVQDGKTGKIEKDKFVEINPRPHVVYTDENGKRYLSIFNNSGNERDIKVGDIIHHEADRTVTVTFKEAITPEKLIEGVNMPVELQRVDEKTYKVHIPATGFVIFTF